VAGYRNGQPGIALARRRRGPMLFCVLKCRFLAAQNGRGAMSDLSPKSATQQTSTNAIDSCVSRPNSPGGRGPDRLSATSRRPRHRLGLAAQE
jgi:hypothetical protein